MPSRQWRGNIVGQSRWKMARLTYSSKTCVHVLSKERKISMPEEKKPSVDGMVLPPGGGKAIHVLGNPWTIKAGVEDTGGSLAVMEGTFRPRSGGPAHVHRQHEETFYVLEGEFLFQLGTQSVKATAGTFVFVPRDVPHAFENVGNQSGRIVGIMTPGG